MEGKIMALDSSLYGVVKAAIVADQVLNAIPAGSDGGWEIARQLNLKASPDFIVWRTNVPIDEIMRNGMAWDRVDNLTVGKARIWDWIGRLGTFDASKPNIRSGIDAAWVGTAADLAVRATVYTHCKRTATVAEKICATGTGTDASPATMQFEGNLTWQDVELARNS
jgi:hypothetical protein